jgi:ubiquinone/menaquinone biosynthesis C-methylase UbiE
MEDNYWKKYWQNKPNETTDVQAQVARTYKKQSIDDKSFMCTLDFVAGNMNLQKSSSLLELAAGNGMFTLPYSERVKQITAVDFSHPLLESLKKAMDNRNITNISIVNANVTDMDFGIEQYSHVLLYFALQYFSEKEAVLLFEKVYKCLKPDGVFYIGDIPDRNKLWEFAYTDEYKKMYFDSIKTDTPAIGTWFLQSDLVEIARYAGFSQIEIINQPEWQFNHFWRFDIKLIKQ